MRIYAEVVLKEMLDMRLDDKIRHIVKMLESLDEERRTIADMLETAIFDDNCRMLDMLATIEDMDRRLTKMSARLTNHEERGHDI